MNTLEKLFSLKGKTAVVTGGAQGIGKAAALHMALVGANIAIWDLQKEEAEKTAAEIAEQANVKTAAIYCDVTDPKSVDNAIKATAEQLSTMDILFNNAGICYHKPVVDLMPEEWLNVINVNLNGVFYVAQAFANFLIKAGKGGSIINTASMSGSIVNFPQPQASYNASKAAVVHFTKSFAIELVSKNIRVNSISPGYIYSPLTERLNDEWKKVWYDRIPMGRMGKAEELVSAVIYLASDSASYTTGCDMIIDGGYCCV